MSLIDEQKAPEATGSEPVWEIVIREAERVADSVKNIDREGIWSLVVADMRDRDALGRARYGTPLTADNGRDHLIDAYQEALDLCVYLRAACMTHAGTPVLGGLAAIYSGVLHSTASIRRLIARRQGVTTPDAL